MNYWLHQLRELDACNLGYELAEDIGLEALTRICTAKTWEDALAAAKAEGAEDYLGWLIGRVLPPAILIGADLRDADLRYAILIGADLRDADLRDADLRYASLIRADLRSADLRGADLRGADLSGAITTGARGLE